MSNNGVISGDTKEGVIKYKVSFSDDNIVEYDLGYEGFVEVTNNGGLVLDNGKRIIAAFSPGIWQGLTLIKDYCISEGACLEE